MTDGSKEICTLLDSRSPERLAEQVYQGLRDLARQRVDGRDSLQATELVHEAYVRLLRNRDVSWQGRAHFFAVAARAMRQILADHARRRRAEKRGGGWERVTLTGVGFENGEHDIVDLHEAMETLAQLDQRKSAVVECRVLANLSVAETAHVLEVSAATVERDWRFASAWLRARLGEKGIA